MRARNAFKAIPETNFMFASLPDTQRETKTTLGYFEARCQWLADNRERLSIRHIWQVGDLVDWGVADPTHFQRADAGIQILENGKVPYTLAVGNHDTAAVQVGGGAAPGDTHANLRDTSVWNSWFPTSRLKYQGVYEAGKTDNAYRTFRAGNLNWLIITLEFMPRAGAISWANTIPPLFPHHNIIVITHMFIDSTSAIGQTNDGYGDQTPQYLYDNLIKLHANIRFTFSGHTGTWGYKQSTGNNGNKIYHILDCWHDGSSNPTRLLNFDIPGRKVTSQVYDPLTNTYRAGTNVDITGISWVK